MPPDLFLPRVCRRWRATSRPAPDVRLLLHAEQLHAPPGHCHVRQATPASNSRQHVQRRWLKHFWRDGTSQPQPHAVRRTQQPAPARCPTLAFQVPNAQPLVQPGGEHGSEAIGESAMRCLPAVAIAV
eukprot:351140-Chlamydomonas_euryale.AAC.31